MTKMFCDRCGAEIQKCKYSWLIHRIVYSELRLSPSGVNHEEIDVHLCPKCEEEFNLWYKKESE